MHPYLHMIIYKKNVILTYLFNVALRPSSGNPPPPPFSSWDLPTLRLWPVLMVAHLTHVLFKCFCHISHCVCYWLFSPSQHQTWIFQVWWFLEKKWSFRLRLEIENAHVVPCDVTEPFLRVSTYHMYLTISQQWPICLPAEPCTPYALIVYLMTSLGIHHTAGCWHLAWGLYCGCYTLLVVQRFYIRFKASEPDTFRNTFSHEQRVCDFILWIDLIILFSLVTCSL